MSIPTIRRAEKKLASALWPLGKHRSVVVDPRRGFGRPTVSGTNVATETIYGFLKGGEKPSVLAHLYSLTESQIEDVKHFHEHCGT